MLGFRLRSPLPFGEEPCPLSLQTVISSINLRIIKGLVLLGQSLGVFDAPSLIFSTSCYHCFGDASNDALNTIFSRAIINAGFSILKISFTIFCALMFSFTEWIKWMKSFAFFLSMTTLWMNSFWSLAKKISTNFSIFL